MATLTTNLFHGQGERDHRLEVVEGHWPDDVEGSVYIVGPDKRGPGGHWFAEQGLVERIRMRTDRDGRVVVEHRRVATTVDRLRARHPRLFAKVKFMELSPFGVSNFANTNVAAIDGRLFLGYDAGRPIEIDPETLEHLTPVGANDEWLQSAPGLLEPLCAVAAHPAVDVEDRAMFFVNYSQLSAPDVARETWLARWDLEGPVLRWRISGMSPYDSIHDIKSTEHHLVISDLPFVVEPEGFRGAPRTRRNQEHTSLWFVPKSDLVGTPAGGTVQATEVRLPMPTGHVLVDREERDGLVRVVLQHMPLADLMISMDPSTVDHRNGAAIDAEYEGMVALAVQPSVIGSYLVDPVTGRVHESEVVSDDERLWGGILTTTDIHRDAARRRQRQIWYAGCGFDPDLVPGDLVGPLRRRHRRVGRPWRPPRAGDPGIGGPHRPGVDEGRRGLDATPTGRSPHRRPSCRGPGRMTRTTATCWSWCTATVTRSCSSSTRSTWSSGRSPVRPHPASTPGCCCTRPGCRTGGVRGRATTTCRCAATSAERSVGSRGS